ncbi:hypothetical protein [Nitrobacter sp. JJSN]|uniref:hypothetical protein n=1 Tax=Nitrobacter sp. JJSN TaxID=3453033 RepID=UPI003F7588F2
MFGSKIGARVLNPGLARIAGGALAIFTALIAFSAGGLALWERGEIKALRADISSTREDLALARRHTAILERQLEARLLSAEQHWSATSRQAQSDESAEKRDDHPAFHLTQDEVLLVRSYIKASPSKAAATIGVGGDLRNVGLVPLPAPIVGKAPRLEGGRFTVDRNGAIVISLQHSRVADVVIQPN